MALAGTPGGVVVAYSTLGTWSSLLDVTGPLVMGVAPPSPAAYPPCTAASNGRRSMGTRVGQTGARGSQQPIGCVFVDSWCPIRRFGPRAERARSRLGVS